MASSFVFFLSFPPLPPVGLPFGSFLFPLSLSLFPSPFHFSFTFLLTLSLLLFLFLEFVVNIDSFSNVDIAMTNTANFKNTNVQKKKDKMASSIG